MIIRSCGQKWVQTIAMVVCEGARGKHHIRSVPLIHPQKNVVKLCVERRFIFVLNNCDIAISFEDLEIV